MHTAFKVVQPDGIYSWLSPTGMHQLILLFLVFINDLYTNVVNKIQNLQMIPNLQKITDADDATELETRMM